ncbi:MAG: beta-propeller domain-containing protein [Bacilli bacterium]|nr:beta-propeller domain-containing protein [Bacilli bacterium]
MKNKTKVVYLIIIILVVLMCSIMTSSNSEIRSVKNEKQLSRFYNRYQYNEFSFVEKLLLLPFSIIVNDYSVRYNAWNSVDYVEETNGSMTKDADASGTKDFSKTNIQVEGVDEADIIKTDGDYIYSISDKNVVITNVKKTDSIKIESRVSNGIPNDLIIYKDKLVVISAKEERSYYKNNTIVSIYDTQNKKKPKLLKSFELYEPYYTTRCIDGKLYVFSKGYLRKENEKVLRIYKEDKETKTISFNNIKYLKNNHSNIQTLIAEVDLNNLNKKLELNSYLIDISNAYVSKRNIYLLDQKYNYDEPELRDLFGIKGVFGLFDSEDTDYGRNTHIYKFRINNGVIYTGKTKLEGSTINQYSLDEKDDNLRVALEGKDGTRIVVLNSDLVEIGKTESVAKGEKMYSSRFMGDKAYLVTYQNTDPLFVIDLSKPENPKVMGELKIPGYSTYLHPYDDTHLIGIGMETEEKTFRDAMGRVTSTTAVVTGMKMSLFDVSDIKNPKQLSKTKIGDSRTVSAILTNPKALLFSKEKNLLAIPVNNYAEDFTSDISGEYEEEINNFTSRSENYISEGYFVYNVNLKDGFNLKGVINHNKSISDYYYYYYNDSRLLRGLYIDNNLYTVSEDAVKVHKLDNLEQVTELKLKGEE